jgi:hypothetical protein
MNVIQRTICTGELLVLSVHAGQTLDMSLAFADRTGFVFKKSFRAINCFSLSQGNGQVISRILKPKFRIPSNSSK